MISSTKLLKAQSRCERIAIPSPANNEQTGFHSVDSMGLCIDRLQSGQR